MPHGWTGHTAGRQLLPNGSFALAVRAQGRSRRMGEAAWGGSTRGAARRDKQGRGGGRRRPLSCAYTLAPHAHVPTGLRSTTGVGRVRVWAWSLEMHVHVHVMCVGLLVGGGPAGPPCAVGPRHTSHSALPVTAKAVTRLPIFSFPPRRRGAVYRTTCMRRGTICDLFTLVRFTINGEKRKKTKKD